ncbi:MAG: RDD family protein [Elainellaceae cyanobacterium]
MELFNTVRIRTPESVELELTLAGVGNRAFALLIDYIVLNLSLLALGILTLFLAYAIELDSAFLRLNIDSQWAIAIMAMIIYAIYVGYFVGFETLMQGQTPGKRRVKIRVIRDSGQPVGLFQSTLRALLRPVDDILFIGFLFILLGRKEKRLGDWLAGTLVVQVDSIETPKLTLSESAQGLAQQLLAEQDISQMLPDDFAAVREYLQRRSQMGIAARSKFSLQLAAEVKDAIGMAEFPPDISTDLFLKAVYLAYQQQFQGGFGLDR